MKNIIVLFVALAFVACNNPAKEETKVNQELPREKEVVTQDTTPRVTGVGGIFFAAENPKEMSAWYGKNLGLAIDPYGSPFEFRNANNPDEINYLRWSPYKAGSTFAAPSKKDLVINYRVQHIEGLVRNLKAAGVNVIDTIATYEYGKFVHLMDPEGNKIELWEANDAFFTAQGGATTK